jgi:hypothetical protein
MLPNRPGALAEMTRKLADAAINIDALYVLRSGPEGQELAVAVNDEETARSTLAT